MHRFLARTLLLLAPWTVHAQAPKLAFPLPGERAPEKPPPQRPDGQETDPGRTLELTPMLVHPDAHNAVDAWLIEIARSDGNPRVLDQRDFLRAVTDVQMARFLSAAAQYVHERWLNGDRSDWRVTEFLDEVKRLALPPHYTIFLLHGHSDVGQLRRGLVRAEVGVSRLTGLNAIQGQSVAWELWGPSLGAGIEWPWRADPYQTTWPLGYAGVGLQATQASGKIAAGDTRLGSVDYFGLNFQVHASARYTLNPSITLHFTAATGFGLGTLRVIRRVFDGDKALTDPCTSDASTLDLNAATKTVRCAVTNAFGIYYSIPVEGGIGATFWGWLDLRAGATWNGLSVDPVVWAPGHLWTAWARLGVVMR